MRFARTSAAAFFFLHFIYLNPVLAAPPADSVELHAHAFMSEGLGPLFRGDFFGPLRATDYTRSLSSQVNPESLEESGVRILVATLYAHPLLVRDQHASLRAQIGQARRFVAESGGRWVLARTPDEAEAALHVGRRVLVLALEGAAGNLDRPEDIAEFIDRDGIAIVTPLHLTDDEYGGAAILPSWHALGSPLGFLRALSARIFRGEHPVDAPLGNPEGLTARGEALVRTLMEHGVWIDLAHASDPALERLLALVRERGQPALFTHTVPRRFHRAERFLSDSVLDRLASFPHGAVVGLMPTEMMLDGDPLDPTDPACRVSCDRRSCEGGIPALARDYRVVAEKIGAASVMFGSDFNGGVSRLKPQCGTGNALDAPTGSTSIAQARDTWDALRGAGAPVPVPLDATVKRFIEAWREVRRP